MIQDSKLDPRSLTSLASLIVDREFPAGVKPIVEGKVAPAALYLVRNGEITLTSANGSIKRTIGAGGYFGDEELLADAKAKTNDPHQPTTIVSEYTVTVTKEAMCGILRLANCRQVMDTLFMGKAPKTVLLDSVVRLDIRLKDLERHRILGAGTFGQVWLVSRDRAGVSKTVYALTVQSKYELCDCGQTKAVVNEKNIMAQFQHPFSARLMGSFQDEDLVYMLMGLVQGGELHSVMDTPKHKGISEVSAKFYAADICEGLAYMHRRGYVYRDLKPENVLVDSEGYPVIVDYGFMKFVTERTYTFCGTPLYIAPEVILNRGHNWGVDHWSMGALLYEMFTGDTPFYLDGMDQMALFKAICKGRYEVPRRISSSAKAILAGFLNRNPSRRLGSLARGEDDIYEPPWFKYIDSHALRLKEIKAPYVPSIKDPLDGRYFEDWGHVEDKLKKVFPKLIKENQAIFDDF